MSDCRKARGHFTCKQQDYKYAQVAHYFQVAILGASVHVPGDEQD